jgi:hypothetical protein
MNSEGHWVLHPTDGALNGARMPPYHRLDVRVTQRFDLRRGTLFVFLDVFNAYDRSNPYSVLTQGFWNDQNGRVEHFDEIEAQLGILPTLGLRWEF